jgi:GTP cyclohydrolase II
VPLQVAEASRVHVFRPQDGGEEHYAIEIGNPDRNKSVLSRLHSACFTGDLIGSLKCDCGHQLQAALEAISSDEDDERNFKIGAEILRLMGFESVRLMTNNPEKVFSMEAVGITVSERVPLKVGSNPLNEKYLETKAKKSGHIL